MSKILCPYCRQEVEDTETKCPYCTTSLVKKDYAKFLVTLSMIFYLLWVLGNTLCFKILGSFPEILRMRDEDGWLVFSISEYIELCIQPVLAAIIPCIITIIKKVRKREAITFICIYVFTALLFTLGFLHLQKNLGV